MRALAFLLFAAIIVLAASGGRADTTKPAWQVIVHPKNGATSVERKFVEDAFLKKTTSWSSGELIRPVDLAPDTATRRAFSADVLRRSVEEVRRYWQQRIFSGRDVPPPELASDDDAIKFVATHEGGIAYVSGGANTPSTVKVIGVR